MTLTQEDSFIRLTYLALLGNSIYKCISNENLVVLKEGFYTSNLLCSICVVLVVQDNKLLEQTMDYWLYYSLADIVTFIWKGVTVI